jgi:tetratricopeptide (TPR) repeat protein
MRLWPSLLLLCALACAHAPPSAPPASEEPQRRIELPPLVVTGRPQEPSIEGKGEQQLFDDGRLLFEAGDFAHAAQHFEALLSAHPDSPHFRPALYNSGLAQLRLGRFREALDRFEQYLRGAQGGEAVDASFQAALCEYRLGKRDAAADRLRALSERPGLPAARKGEAQLQEGVCRFEQGDRTAGERLLRAALQTFDAASRDEVDAALPAQAEFWIGEVFRSDFQLAPLDPATMDLAALEKAIDVKAEYLLSAQGHYLRCIRRGDGEWATAAGFRVGELYESFHDQLMAAPLPKELDADQARLYREELRKKVQVLLGKAIRIYEGTLATAQRVGAQNDYVDRAREALERVKKSLLDDSL